MKNNMGRAWKAFFVFLLTSCTVHHNSSEATLKYLLLIPANQSLLVKQHIELKESTKLHNDQNELFLGDDRQIIAALNYSQKQKIAVLKEYLHFAGNRMESNKNFAFNIGTTANRRKMIEEKLTFSVEVEALYSLSIMLLNHNVSINPVLFNTSTNTVCNYNREEMREIYSIYNNWINELEKDNYKTLSWPLAGSKYAWLGQTENMNVKTAL